MLRNSRETYVMIDQQNERFPLLGGKLETFGYALREKSARLGMRACTDRAARVV